MKGMIFGTNRTNDLLCSILKQSPEFQSELTKDQYVNTKEFFKQFDSA